MRCTQCGTELPDSARFCMQCGSPVKAAEAVKEDTPSDFQGEVCEIRLEANQGVASTEWRFVAEATGPRGRYVVATTQWSGKDPESDLESLTEKLVREGWEPVEGGSGEVGRRFRRPV